MQKVEGSSPFIRSESPCKSIGRVYRSANGGKAMARFVALVAPRQCRLAVRLSSSRYVLKRHDDRNHLQFNAFSAGANALPAPVAPVVMLGLVASAKGHLPPRRLAAEILSVRMPTKLIQVAASLLTILARTALQCGQRRTMPAPW